jgi:hypothetical protein
LYLEDHPQQTESDLEDWFVDFAEPMEEDVQDPTGFGRFRMHNPPENTPRIWEGEIIETHSGEEMTLSIAEEGWEIGWDVGYDGIIDVYGDTLSSVAIRNDIVVWVGDGVHPPQRIRYLPQETSCGGCASHRGSHSTWSFILLLCAWPLVRRGC